MILTILKHTRLSNSIALTSLAGAGPVHTSAFISLNKAGFAGIDQPVRK